MTKPITITDIQVITTQPTSQRLVIVKVITSEPGLYGLGCATFTQRYHAVVAALENHLNPFAIGRDVCPHRRILSDGDGPQLLAQRPGAQQRHLRHRPGAVGHQGQTGQHAGLRAAGRQDAARPRPVYAHADGRDAARSRGERAQVSWSRAITTSASRWAAMAASRTASPSPKAHPTGAYYDPRAYMRNMLNMIEHVRSAVGDRSRTAARHPRAAAAHRRRAICQGCRAIQALLPGRRRWPRKTSNGSSASASNAPRPMAMGELFNNPREWQPLIAGKLIDFMRMHVSQMGGITPARAVALFGQMYGVRTAWHGPGDTSPVGHAANLHLDLWAPNFGIQEWCRFDESGLRDVPWPARSAQRLYVSQRQTGPGHRHRRKAGGQISLPRPGRRSGRRRAGPMARQRGHNGHHTFFHLALLPFRKFYPWRG